MKFTHIPLFLFLSILSLSHAIPVEYKAHNPGSSFELVEIQQEPQHDILLWEKRDIAALTVLFQSLNNSGTIVLARTALQLSLTRDQVCNFVGSFIQTKGLESILGAADQSGLALDLALMVLTHYETVDGLIDVIQYAKNGGGSSSNSTVGNVASDVGNTVGSAVSGAGSIVGGIVSGIGSIFGFGSGSSSSSTTSGVTSSTSVTKTSSQKSNTSTASAILSDISKVVNTIATATSPVTFPISSQQVSLPTNLATKPVTGGSTSTASTTKVTGTSKKTSSSNPATTTGSSGNIVGNVVSGIGSVVSSIFGREDLAEVAEKEGLVGLMKRDDVDTDLLMHELLKRALEENLTPLQKRDALSLVYSQIISIIGTNSNIEQIFESLAKSGLARNVVYNALMDSGFYQFDVQLYKYLVDGGYISLSTVVSAAFSSGLVQSIVTTFVKNSTYLKLVINFVLAIFTGKVKVFALLKLIF